jgi:hypothetical protein
MGVTVRTHLLVELLPCLLDLPAALGWQTTAVVALFVLFVCGPRPRPATTDRPRPAPRSTGTTLCLATLVLLVLLAA